MPSLSLNPTANTANIPYQPIYAMKSKASLFGRGLDGSLSIGAATWNINTSSPPSPSPGAPVRTQWAAPLGVTSISNGGLTIDTASSTVGKFFAGDEVIIMNMRGGAGAVTNVGNWERATVASVTTFAITLTNVVTQVYGNVSNASLTGQTVIIQRLPEFQDVTLTNAASIVTGPTWDGSVGGLVAFIVAGTLKTTAVGGSIRANSLGFRGGARGSGGGGGSGGNGTPGSAGASGESVDGLTSVVAGGTGGPGGPGGNGMGTAGGIPSRPGGGGGSGGGAGAGGRHFGAVPAVPANVTTGGGGGGMVGTGGAAAGAGVSGTNFGGAGGTSTGSPTFASLPGGGNPPVTPLPGTDIGAANMMTKSCLGSGGGGVGGGGGGGAGGSGATALGGDGATGIISGGGGGGGALSPGVPPGTGGTSAAAVPAAPAALGVGGLGGGIIMVWARNLDNTTAIALQSTGGAGGNGADGGNGGAAAIGSGSGGGGAGGPSSSGGGGAGGSILTHIGALTNAAALAFTVTGGAAGTISGAAATGGAGGTAATPGGAGGGDGNGANVGGVGGSGRSYISYFKADSVFAATLPIGAGNFAPSAPTYKNTL